MGEAKRRSDVALREVVQAIKFARASYFLTIRDLWTVSGHQCRTCTTSEQGRSRYLVLKSGYIDDLADALEAI